MNGFLSTLAKELKIMSRDRAGLAVLFAMPICLVLIVTMVQDNVMKITGATVARAIFVDQDGGEAARLLRELLDEQDSIETAHELEGKPPTLETAREAVAAGEFLFGVAVVEGTSEKLSRRADELAGSAFSAGSQGGADGAAQDTPQADMAEFVVFFDPASQGALRTSVISALNQAALGIEIEFKTKALSANFQSGLSAIISEQLGEEALAGAGELPSFHWSKDKIAGVRTDELVFVKPSSVQQNVPSWALFGMFFIVVPLSGAIVRERHDGMLRRIIAAPAPTVVVLGGKLAAYSMVAFFQFCVMVLIGIFILPLLGPDGLEIGPSPLAIVLIALAASLAASSYGMLVGSVAKSYEQASVFGAVSVVMAAAIGGVMIPSYAMPPGIRSISHFSPLNWGLEAFLDLFMRGSVTENVYVGGALLISMTILCTLLSWIWLVRNRG